MRHIWRMESGYEAHEPPPDPPVAARPRWRWSLRARVGFMLATLMFIIALILGALAGQVSVGQLRERIGSSLGTDAARMAERLNKEMSARSRELMLLGALNPLRTLSDPKDVTALLDQLRKTVPSYMWIGIADPAGKIIVATDPKMVGSDFTSRVEQRDNARPDASGREQIRPITLIHPVRRQGGALVASVIVAQLSWDWVRDIERSQMTLNPQHPGDREVVLVSAEDLVLVGPPNLQGRRLMLPTVVRTRAGFYGWTVERFPNGTEYLTGAAFAQGEVPFPGPGSEPMRWTVLVRESSAAAFAPAGELRTMILLAGLGLAAVFALVGWLLAGRITSPLRRIADAADRLRQGEDVELPRIQGVASEIETLSSSLRALVTTLTSKQTALDALETESQHDPLTGLLNRVGLQEWFRRAKVRARLQPTGMLLLIGDLDGFKQVNDTLGHSAGDQLLRAMAQRLTHSVRGKDAVARLGGDEFVVALDAPQGLNDQDALDTTRRLWSAVVGRYEIGGCQVQLGLSLGGSFWPDDGAEIETVLEQADAALYAAKRAGKGRIALFRDLRPSPVSATVR